MLIDGLDVLEDGRNAEGAEVGFGALAGVLDDALVAAGFDVAVLVTGLDATVVLGKLSGVLIDTPIDALSGGGLVPFIAVTFRGEFFCRLVRL